MTARIELRGRLAADPEMKFTPSGKGVTSFTVVTSRPVKQPDGTWSDEDTTFWRASVWDVMAERVAEGLHKGDAVLLTGQPYLRSYDKQDGTKGTSLEVRVDAIGPDLRWVSAVASRPERATQSTPRSDPWATPSSPKAAPSSSWDDIPF